MFRRPPRSTRTDTLFPYTTLFRSIATAAVAILDNVSIHASAQEATSCLVVTPQSRSGFDPRLRAGGDLATIKAASVAPTRSEESRVGKECVGTCRSRWPPTPEKKHNQQYDTIIEINS